MKLNDLITGLIAIEQLPDAAKDLQISGLALDSRHIKPGYIFFALAGANQHGLTHLPQALGNGANVVFYDPKGESGLATPEVQVPLIAVTQLEQLVGEIAARFYGQPSRNLSVIGITGTNGKTSCSQFLAQLLENCGIIGTLGWGDWGRLQSTVNTTPDALSIQHIMADFLATNKQAVAMEVSSHGLAQGRVNGVYFKGAVFTNISRDHLDYHGTMTAYLNAKLTLLDKPGLAFVVVNLDDAASVDILAAIPKSIQVWGFSVFGKSLQNIENIVAEHVAHKIDGIEFNACWQDQCQRVTVPLYGDFNIENVLSVMAVMLAMGIAFTEVLKRIAQLQPVSGRMERFGGGEQPLVFVDYAHTPDALNKVLASLRQHCQQTLWVVFGCGGNRDAGKRPLMGAVAAQWADHVLITDDNPRFEESQVIIDAILTGCQSSKVRVIADRTQAIKTAIHQAKKGDCVVIAGKGHEAYQDVAGIRTPYSDCEVVLTALTHLVIQT
jgi:UDP-N-acetylmuramoyl-L-alanyl-D-glutamate--2,6-diaminopimelate ligase